MVFNEDVSSCIPTWPAADVSHGARQCTVQHDHYFPASVYREYGVSKVASTAGNNDSGLDTNNKGAPLQSARSRRYCDEDTAEKEERPTAAEVALLQH